METEYSGANSSTYSTLQYLLQLSYSENPESQQKAGTVPLPLLLYMYHPSTCVDTVPVVAAVLLWLVYT